MSNCRICRGKLKKIIDLGKIALVGDFTKKLKKQKKYKISLNFCIICKHIQISEVLNPNLLFKNYLWETGVSSSNVSLIKNLVKNLKKYNIKKDSKIIEIASNDGSFLNIIRKKYKCVVLGVDPAKNFKTSLQRKNIPSIINFFNFNLSKKNKKKIWYV